ncbi:hypothetical protein AAGF08_09685 [Algoriphagus sp. SE2]|uniref:hypothetical protein n=1 Tax=Algoriphagus sp. SE2 TaxID=3141536 RepID=UPI0031CD20AD
MNSQRDPIFEIVDGRLVRIDEIQDDLSYIEELRYLNEHGPNPTTVRKINFNQKKLKNQLSILKEVLDIKYEQIRRNRLFFKTIEGIIAEKRNEIPYHEDELKFFSTKLEGYGIIKLNDIIGHSGYDFWKDCEHDTGKPLIDRFNDFMQWLILEFDIPKS